MTSKTCLLLHTTQSLRLWVQTYQFWNLCKTYFFLYLQLWKFVVINLKLFQWLENVVEYSLTFQGDVYRTMGFLDLEILNCILIKKKDVISCDTISYFVGFNVLLYQVWYNIVSNSMIQYLFIFNYILHVYDCCMVFS